MITFTDEQAIAIFDAISDDETYTAQAIFDQVWEAPYDWFQLTGTVTTIPNMGIATLPATVAEIEEGSWTIVSHHVVTEEMIKIATINLYFEVIYPQNNERYNRSLYDFMVDVDANDVDAILQFACFGKLIYS